MDPNESRVWNVKSIKWKSAAKKKKGKKKDELVRGRDMYLRIDR